VVIACAACGRIGFDTRAADGAMTQPPLPIAAWSFEEGAGTTAADSTGNGYTLGLVNGVSWVAGVHGTAVQGNGVDGYLATFAKIDVTNTRAVTVSLWLSHSYAGGALFRDVAELSQNFNNADAAFGVFVDDSMDCGAGPSIGIGVHGNNGASADCYTAPATTGWHHLVAVFDMTQPGCCQSALYFDGAKVDGTVEFADANTDVFTSDVLYLLSRGGASAFDDAAIDELAIYDSALDPAQIAAL
jgi:alpha-N-arabinofuranosidase